MPTTALQLKPSICLELKSACKAAVERLDLAAVEDLPFWDLMYYTCD